MSKYLVYTCVTGDYDKVRKILGKQDNNIDFVCFTDRVDKMLNMRAQTGWIFMPIPNELSGLDNRRKARIIKIGIYKYMKGYDGYLWIDAPILVIGNIGDFIRKYPFTPNRSLYVSKHYMRDCVYQEFAQVLRLNKDRHVNVYEQYQRYHRMGYPQHNGMAETSLLYRNLKDEKVLTHASFWIDEILNYSYRDQLSFNWAAWYSKTPITYLNEDIYKKDVENETSNYFFLPWPKHNNPNVAYQLQMRLQNNSIGTNSQKNQTKLNNNVTIVDSASKKNATNVDKFEQEYQAFLEELKKRSQIKNIEFSDGCNKDTTFNMSKMVLPVVITTHNRTKVASTVIESLAKNLKFAGRIEYCICDDRSNPGHVDELVQTFKACGIKPMVKRASKKHFGLGASLNKGLEWGFKKSPFVLTTEDDWLLVRPLDMTDKVEKILKYDIAGIRLATTSAPNSLKKTSIDNYSCIVKDCLKQYIFNNQVMLRHKRIFDKIGFMKENCEPAEQEKDIVTKYNEFSNFGETMPVLYPNELDTIPSLYGEHNYFHHIGISTDPSKIRPIKAEHAELNKT